MAIESNNALQIIYEEHKGGQIEVCVLGRDSVYSASINAYDAPTILYSYQGKQIGSCNYAFNLVDSICYNLTDCRVIYRGRKHISDEPFVDVYHLENSP